MVAGGQGPARDPARAGDLTAATWYPDPLGRHDHRLWSGEAWTEQVSDYGRTSIDPIEPITPNPVTIRPSSRALRSRFNAFPLWRRAVAYVALVILALLFAVPIGVWGWPGAILTAFALISIAVLRILYFRLFYMRGDQTGIEIRNQVGIRKFIPRDRIGLISVGNVWGGSLTTNDFLFIVSPAAEQLARSYLQNWDVEDVRKLAHSVGLHLYGRPGRPLDELHSGRAVQRTAMHLSGSMAAGLVIGLVLPVLMALVLFAALVLGRR